MMWSCSVDLGSMSKDALPVLILTLVMVLPGPLDAQDVVIASEGNSINITCSTSEALLGIYLKKTWPRHSNMIYFEDGENATVDKDFSGRIDFSGSQNNLTITIRLLRRADMGIYTCQAVTKIKKDGPSTMLVVTEKVSQEPQEISKVSQEPQEISVFLLAVMAAGFFLIGLVLGMLGMLRKTQIEELCASRKKDSRCVVYEDMSYKHKTPCDPNPYQ
uniref:T-cell antigen CD7 n=1 Tax=Myodes glareolus TaxID=447135 RepID=UPI0020214448|nr:T-cell antigen CD7 [Myodes glareolus]XP_048285343.1 T-cell antigen CD7 [Myodes glareolus]